MPHKLVYGAVDQSTRRRLRHELATLRHVVRIPMVLVNTIWKKLQRLPIAWWC
jgi:hypothetical protein